MVRFSDIVINEEKKEQRKKDPASETKVEREESAMNNAEIAGALSDTQILKVRGERSSLSTRLI